MQQLHRSTYTSLLASVRPSLPDAHTPFKLLITDTHTRRLLSALLPEPSILALDVVQTRQIEHAARDPPAQWEAVYLLSPTTQNIDRLISQYADPNHTPALAVHLFFVLPLPEHLLHRLSASALLHRLDRAGQNPLFRTLKDIYTDARPRTANTFSTDQPDALFSLYPPPSSSALTEVLDRKRDFDLCLAAKRIAASLILLGAAPPIRYAAANPLNRRLASLLSAEIQAYKLQDPSFPPSPSASSNGRPPPLLLLLDRSQDLYPLITHDFHYAPLALDLLPLDPSSPDQPPTYRYAGGEGEMDKEDHVLDDADQTWTTHGHRFISDVTAALASDLDRTKKQSDAYHKSDSSVAQMQDMLAGLADFEKQKKEVYVHTNMASDAMDQVQRRHLMDVAEVEQMCATGVDKDGKGVKSADIIQAMIPLLDDSRPTNKDKVRMVIAFILFKHGVTEEDKKRLYQHARLDQREIDMVEALPLLGAKLTKRVGEKETKKVKQERDFTYSVTRYEPLARCLLEDFFAGKLDHAAYPTLGQENAPPAPGASAAPAPASNLRVARPTWHKAATARSAQGIQSPDANRQRVVVFMLGGITHSEVRAMTQAGLAANKEVIIGSTHFYTPEQFLNEIRHLHRSGRGSMHAPNLEVARDPYTGASRPGAPSARDFQKMFDAAFRTEDAQPLPPPVMPVQQAPISHAAPPMPQQAPRVQSPANNIEKRFSKDKADKETKEKKKGWKSIF